MGSVAIMDYRERYDYWISSPFFSREAKQELLSLSDEKEIEDRFYRTLEFGTGGMRGVMAIGDNRMNIYTVGRAVAGVAKYLKATCSGPVSVVIAHDCRNNSELFTKVAAANLLREGIRVLLFHDLTPTPVLSFAVRHLGCSAGFVLTASHNPKIYNGLKVYNSRGEQLVVAETDKIAEYIAGIPYEEVISDPTPFESRFEFVPEETEKAFVEAVLSYSITDDREAKKDLKIVYTPLHGTGGKYVRAVLSEDGFGDFTALPEQSLVSGDFPTVVSPNPEEKAALNMAISLADRIGADIVLGTDPDSDRLGIAVRHQGKMTLMTGNQVGAILAEFLFTYKKLPVDPVMVKTIVTGDMGELVAKSHGVRVIDTLTGFKNICSHIDRLSESKEGEFVFGYEESYGYLVGKHVRDKDGISAAMTVCEAAATYKKTGKDLFEIMEELYTRYGRRIDFLDSVVYPGKEGAESIHSLMVSLRQDPHRFFSGIKEVKDYLLGIDGIEKADVLKLFFDDGSFLACRPSGTEPKIKFYYSVVCSNEKQGEEKLKKWREKIRSITA